MAWCLISAWRDRGSAELRRPAGEGDRPANSGHLRSSGAKTIRCDRSPQDDRVSPFRGDQAGLLNQFRRWLAAPPQELKGTTRYASMTYAVWLGWWQAEHEFLALTARLANISRGGARPPGAGRQPRTTRSGSAWGPPNPTNVFAAQGVPREVRAAPRGKVRAPPSAPAFGEPCPSRFLEAGSAGGPVKRAGGLSQHPV